MKFNVRICTDKEIIKKLCNSEDEAQTFIWKELCLRKYNGKLLDVYYEVKEK